MKRNTLLIVVIAVAAVFMLFPGLSPFSFLTGRSNAPRRGGADAATATALLKFAEDSWRSPEDYIVYAFSGHDIVFLAEFYKIRQNLQLVSGLLPRLYAAGVRNLGIEYALSDDQARIDSLVTAAAWNEAEARAITFDWLSTWGYQEYVDLYKAAWQLNRNRSQGAPPFRVVALNVRQNWEYLQTDADANNPDSVAKILANGVPDVHIAEVIESEFVTKGQKALVLCGTQHAFTRYVSAQYAKNATASNLGDTRRAGNIVYDRITSRAFAISLHAPWPDVTQKIGFGYPVGGAIDVMIDALPPAHRSGGWNTAGTPLGALSIKGSVYEDGAQTGTLADLFDGYIVMGPIVGYTFVTPIKDFVNDSNLDTALKHYPGVKASAPKTAEAINKSIAAELDSFAGAFAQFR